MQSLDFHPPRITTLSDIELKRDEIHQLFRNSIKSSFYCSDFLQVKCAVIQHFKEAVKYINRCILSISEKLPLSHLQLFNHDDLFGTIDTDAQSTNIEYTLDQIQVQFRDLSAAIDQWVFVIRDYPDIETKPHTLLLAKAMCEIFQIQHFYIYPFREDLIPDFLRKSNFRRDIDAPIK